MKTTGEPIKQAQCWQNPQPPFLQYIDSQTGFGKGKCVRQQTRRDTCRLDMSELVTSKTELVAGCRRVCHGCGEGTIPSNKKTQTCFGTHCC